MDALKNVTFDGHQWQRVMNFKSINAFSDCQKYGANGTKPRATRKKIKTKSSNNEIINVKKLVGAEVIRTYNIQVITFDNESCSERKCPNAKMHLVLVKMHSTKTNKT